MRHALESLALFAAAGALSVALTGCEKSPGAAASAEPVASAGATPMAPANHAAPMALIGKELPAILLHSTTGQTETLAGADGKPTVLVLWSTWCQACLHETAQLTTWADSRKDVGLEIVNVDGLMGDEPDLEKVSAQAKKIGVTGPVWTTRVADLPKLGVRTCPVSLVVDAKGIVKAAREGYKGADEMNQWLDRELTAL